jgi:hypothetical protein
MPALLRTANQKMVKIGETLPLPVLLLPIAKRGFLFIFIFLFSFFKIDAEFIGF